MKGDYGKIPLEVSASGQGTALKRGWQCFVVGFFGVVCRGVAKGFPGGNPTPCLHIPYIIPIRE